MNLPPRLAIPLLLCAAVPAMADSSGPSFGSPSHFTETGGQAVYAAACAGCHQPDGRGAVGAAAYPSLVQDGRLAAAAYPVSRVLRGRGAMPPFGRTLSDDQVAAVVDYIRTHFGNGYAPGPGPAEVGAAR